MPSELETAALRFRRQVLTNERQAADTMVRAYGEAWQRVRADLTALQQQIDAARAQGLIPDTFVPRQPGGPVIPRTPGTFSPSWLYQQERYQTLQRQIEREMRALAEYADGVVMAGQQEAIQAGLAHSTELATVAGGPNVTAVFNRLPREAVQDLVGFASDGSPLRSLFDALGPQVSQGMRDALTTAVATGMGPRETARLIRRQFGMGLTRALRISRTETLRAYREAGRRNYEANADVIGGWQWLCACDRRSCASCWAMHGSIHTVKETLDDHPNGRCAMVPIVKGFKPAIKRTGSELFAELPEGDQRQILGPAAHLAYQDGAVQLGDFVGRKNDPQWGTMRYAKSLSEILGSKTAANYVSLVHKQNAWKPVTEKIKKLTDHKAVLSLGKISPSTYRAISRQWPTSITSRIVLTGERRAHYLARHADMAAFESELMGVLFDPDEVHRNRYDANMAIFYRRIDQEHFLRVAIWVSDDQTKQNSVFSFRKARIGEVENERRNGRRVWRKWKKPLSGLAWSGRLFRHLP